MKQKFEFSKILAMVTMLLFIITLVISFYFMFFVISIENLNILDLGIFTVAITSTGGLLGTTIKHYYSKSGLQNVTQIKKSFYEEAMRVRLNYDKEVLEMMNQYNVDKCNIDDIENDAPFKELSDSIVSDMETKFDELDNNNSAEPTID